MNNANTLALALALAAARQRLYAAQAAGHWDEAESAEDEVYRLLDLLGE